MDRSILFQSFKLSLSLALLGCDPATFSLTSIESDMRVISAAVPDEFDANYSDAYADNILIDDPCDPNPCETGAQCLAAAEMSDQTLPYTCLFISCDEQQCPPGTQCEESQQGSICISLGCNGPEECESDEYCDSQSQCQPDLCTTNLRSCQGADVMICSADGSQLERWVTCPLGELQCVDVPQGEAACVCIDDWECPEYMRCESGRCFGRAEPPSCLLAPQPFSSSLPTPEIIWGGNADNPQAIDSPLPESSQVVMTPLVANLTDDNGDGLINESDIPEVIFMTFCNSSFTSDGVLRAIHGGGVKRGQDLFASVGEQHWYEGDDISSFQPTCNEAILDSTAGIAVANLDPIGGMYPEPEIIAVHENNGLVIYNHQGELISNGLINEGPNIGANPTPSIAQLDGQGMAEIILSKLVYTLARQGDEILVLDRFEGDSNRGINGQGGISCVGDLNGDGRMDIVAGGTLYRFPTAPNGAVRTSDCVENGGIIMPQTADEESWCRGELPVIWNDSNLEGFCAIADIWGAIADQAPGPQNPLDQIPEVILITNGKLVILNGQTGEHIYERRYGGTSDKGGAPNIGDFDGDGFPEVGSAFAAGYVMMDLQDPSVACPSWDELTVDEEDNGLFGRPPRSPGDVCIHNEECAVGALCIQGQCRCAHQGWRRSTEDGSSRVTGSTLFDFNGDGAVEVIYNDECFFRIYDGSTGMTLFKQASESRTRIEHPIVADVDADGNAEIVFSTSTESRFCSVRNQRGPNGQTYASLYNPGIEVWGDPQDLWVSARKIWNQHAYHVTHITESGDVPLSEPNGWQQTNGRAYNTYRSQPLSFGIAPDLIIETLRVTSSQSQCGEEPNEGIPPLNVNVTIRNDGEVQVGSGLQVSLSARWSNQNSFTPLLNPNGNPLGLVTTAPLLPNSSQILTLSYQPSLDPSSPHISAGVNAPVEVKAVVDPPIITDFGRERECNEGNNELISSPTSTESLSDLSIQLNSTNVTFCPDISLGFTIINTGSAPVNRVEVGLYLGNPYQGGTRIDSYLINDPIPAQSSVDIDWMSTQFPEYRTAIVYLMVDPSNVITECDDNNNLAESEGTLSCQVRDGK